MSAIRIGGVDVAKGCSECGEADFSTENMNIKGGNISGVMRYNCGQRVRYEGWDVVEVLSPCQGTLPNKENRP